MTVDRNLGLCPIGQVRTGYTTPASTPVQTRRNAEAEGRVELDPRWAPMLEDLAGFDYAWLLTWLDHADAPPADGRVTPYLLGHLGRRIGLFATRHPARPNPIGLSVVRVVAVTGATMVFRGVDLVDRTPLLDIKPWHAALDVPRWSEGADAVAGIRGGWYADAHPDQTLPR